MAIQNFVKVSQDHKHIIVKSGGLRGSEGPQGPQGPAGTVAIGTTTTLAPESSATVTNTGTAENAILNFGIPKGSKGDKGDQGIQGPKGDPGAGLIITGSVDTYAELPSGFGPDDAGKAYFVQADGKLYVWSGTQWPADGDGAQFEGPKGDTGATGDTGPAGYSPSASVVKVGDTTTITITDEHGTTTANVNDGITPTIDSALSTTSENPVQNKIVTGALNNKQATLQAGDVTNTLIADDAITTSKVADGAITSDKIDWTTSCEIVSNTNGTAYKFGNGLMICTVAKEVTTDATYGVTRWDYPVAFISAPVVCSNTTRTSGYKNALARVDGTNTTYVQFAWINAGDNTQLKSETIPAFSAVAVGKWK